MANALASTVLGRTNLNVTRLSYGAMEIRGARIWGGRPVTEDQAQIILNAVLDAGITLIDTANDYGRSEEFIGKFIAHRRHEYTLATKCGCSIVHRDETTDDTPHIWTRENLFRGLHESLERMKTDVIDIMQLHNPPVEETQRHGLVALLQEMKQQGKIRFVSISTTLPHLPHYLTWGVFDSFQIPYSALERDHEDWITQAAQAALHLVANFSQSAGKQGVDDQRQDAAEHNQKSQLPTERQHKDYCGQPHCARFDQGQQVFLIGFLGGADVVGENGEGVAGVVHFVVAQRQALEVSKDGLANVGCAFSHPGIPQIDDKRRDKRIANVK